MSVQAKPRADLDAAVTAAKDRLTAARRDRVRAEHELDAATAAAERARATLSAEFGVDTVAAAKKMLAKLEAELETALATVETDLGKVEKR